MRRADGQMVQLGPLMYGLLEEVDGERDHDALAAAMSERLGRRLEPEHVARIGEKLAEQGLLAGSEDNAPPRSNPLLALRWKVLVHRPEGDASASRAPFELPVPPVAAAARRCVGFARRLLVRADPQGRRGGDRRRRSAARSCCCSCSGSTVASAAFHEIGHAAACRYGGGTPGRHGRRHLHRLARLLHGRHRRLPAAAARPAAHRPRRHLLQRGHRRRSRSASGSRRGVDALLLLIALQMLEIVKNLSPVIRADGYHILSDATGVPDLYAHMGPTLKRLLPWKRSASRPR